MSTSILYLAIVAIWACFLVPAWLRRPNGSKASSRADLLGGPRDGVQADGAAGEGARGDGAAVGGEQAASDFEVEVSGGAAEYLTKTENGVEVELEADLRVEVSRRAQERRAQERRIGEADYAEAEHRGAELGAAGRTEADYAEVGERTPSWPSQSRDQMLRARRRMLSILTVLTAITCGFAALGVVKWWICVPPLAMLVLYVLLLREVALADTELAYKRREWEARAAEEARQAREADAPPTERPTERRRPIRWEEDGAGVDGEYSGAPTAEVIDISERVGDQLYDQYADAAVRAVGD